MWRFAKQVNLVFTTLFLVFNLLRNYSHTYYKHNINSEWTHWNWSVKKNLDQNRLQRKFSTKLTYFLLNFKLFNCPASVIHGSKYQVQFTAWKWITIIELRIPYFPYYYYIMATIQSTKCVKFIRSGTLHFRLHIL